MRNTGILVIIIGFLILGVAIFAGGVIEYPVAGKYDVHCDIVLDNAPFSPVKIANTNCYSSVSTFFSASAFSLADTGNLQMAIGTKKTSVNYKVYEDLSIPRLLRVTKTLTITKVDAGTINIAITVFDDKNKPIDNKIVILNLGG